jgi:hypothetical protein
MCTSADTVLTTTSMTAVSVSMRNAQETSSAPVSIQRITLTVKAGSSDRATLK